MTNNPDLETEIENLIAVLMEEDNSDAASLIPSPQEKAQTALFLIGEAAVPALLGVLRNDAPEMRLNAITLLAEIENIREVELFLQICQDKNESHQIRSGAVYILGLQKDKRAVEPLIQILQNERLSYLSSGVITTLGELGDEKAVEPLTRILLNGSIDSWTRGSAAQALGKIGGSVAFEALTNKLKSLDYPVHGYIVEALATFKDERVFNLLDQFVNDYSGYIIEEAIRGLATYGDTRIVPKLLKLIEEPGELKAKQAAIQALGKLRDVRAYEPLATLVRKRDKNLNYLATAVLGELGDARAFDLLLAEMKQVGRMANPNAPIGLGMLKDPRGFEPLVELLQKQDTWLSGNAARGLSELGDLRALLEVN